MAVTRSMAARSGMPPVSGLDRIRRARRWVKRYKPTDTAHRHRLNDTQPKSQQVSGYVRRT